MDQMVETKSDQKVVLKRPSIIKRKYLVDPGIQLKVVLFLGGISFLCAIGICVIAYERLMQLNVLFNNSMVAPIMLPQAFKAIANSLMIRLLTIVGAMILIFIWAGILLTHKLAGPIWKLQYQLKKFLEGEEIEPLRFRQGDAFKELPELINKLVEGYKK